MTENLTRAYQKIFAKNAGAQGKTVFGSTAQGNTQYTTDINAMQSEAYENGFADAVVSKKAPVMQDFNTVENITTRQLAYLFQKGIPEWNSETTYFKGNIVLNIESDIPVLYYSLINNNINNELTDTASWSKMFDNSSGGAQVVGQIIQVLCSSNYIPNGCLPCDGSEYTKAQFSDLWNNYLTANPLLETCTYEEYQTSINSNGFCEKFAIDTINNKFKVPTFKSVIYQNTDTTFPVIGNGKVLGLTNSSITGGLSADGSNSQRLMASTGSPIGSDVTTAVPTSGSTITGKLGVVQEANNSGLIAQNKANASINFFVVVANGEINQSQMDWSAWATSLQGKANTDLNNITTAAKSEITKISAVSNSYVDLTLNASNSYYTAPANGYFSFSKLANNSGQSMVFRYVDDSNKIIASISTAISTGNQEMNITAKCYVGQRCQIYYNLGGVTNFFRFVYDFSNNN